MNGLFGNFGNNDCLWLLLLMSCCGGCNICDILPIILIMNCCCNNGCK